VKNKIFHSAIVAYSYVLLVHLKHQLPLIHSNQQISFKNILLKDNVFINIKTYNLSFLCLVYHTFKFEIDFSLLY
jgi:hypothetical protein